MTPIIQQGEIPLTKTPNKNTRWIIKIDTLAEQHILYSEYDLITVFDEITKKFSDIFLIKIKRYKHD